MITDVIMGPLSLFLLADGVVVSLRSTGANQIPAATLAVARAAFRKGSVAIRIRDALSVLLEDTDFAAAFSTRGRPALSPARLALVSILQFGAGRDCPTASRRGTVARTVPDGTCAPAGPRAGASACVHGKSTKPCSVHE